MLLVYTYVHVQVCKFTDLHMHVIAVIMVNICAGATNLDLRRVCIVCVHADKVL